MLDAAQAGVDVQHLAFADAVGVEPLVPHHELLGGDVELLGDLARRVPGLNGIDEARVGDLGGVGEAAGRRGRLSLLGLHGAGEDE